MEIDRAEVERLLRSTQMDEAITPLPKVCRYALAKDDALKAALQERDNAIKTARQRAGEHERQVKSMEQEIAALETDNARLRAALEPFAEIAKHFDSINLDHETFAAIVRSGIVASRLTFGDCRRALKALEQ